MCYKKNRMVQLALVLALCLATVAMAWLSSIGSAGSAGLTRFGRGCSCKHSRSSAPILPQALLVGGLPAALLQMAAEGSDGDSADKAGESQGIKDRLFADMKTAMKEKQKERLAAIRAIQTAIKQKEVDDRVQVDDAAAVAVMSKLIKQRKESIQSYTAANRLDLAETEQKEVEVITEYLPAQLSPQEIEQIISDCIAKAAATTIKDMGKVMGLAKPLLEGKADIAEVGAAIRKRLSS